MLCRRCAETTTSPSNSHKNCTHTPTHTPSCNSIDRRFASPTAQYWLNNVVRALVICFCAALVIGIHQLGLIISLIGKLGVQRAREFGAVSPYPVLLRARVLCALPPHLSSSFFPRVLPCPGSLGSGLLALIFPPLFHLLKMRKLYPKWVVVKDAVVLTIGIVGEKKGKQKQSGKGMDRSLHCDLATPRLHARTITISGSIAGTYTAVLQLVQSS